MLTFPSSGCGTQSEDAGAGATPGGAGGVFIAAGGSAAGGLVGSGGAVANAGGMTGAGGIVGSGGIVGAGGIGGAGGVFIGAGGVTGSGGIFAGGSAGVSAGGMAGTTATGGSGGGGRPTCGGGTAMNGDVTVDLSDLHQKISGFGASTAWGSTMSNADADLLWSTSTGAGLSLHRIRIDYQTGHTSELNIAKLAVSHGVTVWASPWTPPAADKTGATGQHGEVEGTLSNPQAFATFLAGFVSYMKGQGVNIYAVSAQNEPDANVSYESCEYTPSSMASFVGGYMGPTLSPMGVKIMAPETQNWCGFPSFESALLGDANATMYTSIIATHEYGCSPKAYPEIAQAGKEFWETEIYDTNNGEDPGMGSGLRVAKLIHDAMTIASMNAWHYWWVYPAGGDNGALWDYQTKQPSKRLWVMGNFSRFVRPGFQRVGTTGTPPSGVLISAYTNPADGSVAVVAINNSNNAVPLSLFISGAAPCQFTPWVTSTNDNIVAKTAVSASSSRLSVTLDAQSVTTLLGTP